MGKALLPAAATAGNMQTASSYLLLETIFLWPEETSAQRTSRSLQNKLTIQTSYKINPSFIKQSTPQTNRTMLCMHWSRSLPAASTRASHSAYDSQMVTRSCRVAVADLFPHESPGSFFQNCRQRSPVGINRSNMGLPPSHCYPSLVSQAEERNVQREACSLFRLNRDSSLERGEASHGIIFCADLWV